MLRISPKELRSAALFAGKTESVRGPVQSGHSSQGVVFCGFTRQPDV